jgi:hypothetical protein
MALSPRDQAFYKEKLGWKSFFYLFIATLTVGVVLWPLMLFLLDWSSGRAGEWTFSAAWNLALANVPLAMVVSSVMWLVAQFYLWMGWLPARR